METYSLYLNRINYILPMIRHFSYCMMHGGAFTCIHPILPSTLFTFTLRQRGWSRNLM